MVRCYSNRAITLPIPTRPEPPNPPRRSSLTHSLRLYNLPAPPAVGVTLDPGSPVPDLPPSPNRRLPNSLDFIDPFMHSPQRSHTNSAPPTPAAAAVIHPSAFIHTHHPRRASLTPMGLNLISPVPPSPQVQEYVRRESAGGALAAGWSGGSGSPLRRKSLTPSISTLAMASPTRLTATGSIARRGSGISQSIEEGIAGGAQEGYPSGGVAKRRTSAKGSVSEGEAGIYDEKPRLQEGIAAVTPGGSMISPALLSALSAGIANGRRASQPIIQYTPATAWPSTEGSPLKEEKGFHFGGPSRDQGFKFGGGNASSSIQEPLSPRAMEFQTPNPSNPNSLKFPGDGFGMSTSMESEAAEAERQRVAFLSATYGNKPRSSIGGVSTRRQSALRDGPGGFLMGNEGYRRGSMGIPGYDGPDSGLSGQVGPLLGGGGDADDSGRRGSLPMAIPSVKSTRRPGPMGRSSTSEEGPSHDDFADELSPGSSGIHPGISADPSQQYVPPSTPPRQRQALARPLPPLLPLSDPGPRLLPSTLALHRASHLLQSRNLASEPMPAPLPPSLHPPEPVNVSDFDIDFILAGNAGATAGPSSLGAKDGQGASASAAFPGRNAPPPGVSRTSTTTLKLGAGGEDEDTFAKFVGEFDDEYDDRRGEWTFKMCPSSRDPVYQGSTPKHKSRAVNELVEWESLGAGKYFIHSSGEVKSAQSGRTWRVKRLPGREYEVELVEPSTSYGKAKQSDGPRIAYTLASKLIHGELGGVKLPYSQFGESFASAVHSKPINRRRVDSQDSTASTSGKVSHLFSKSLPFHMAHIGGDHHRQSSALQHDISASPVDPYLLSQSTVGNGLSRGRADKREKIAFAEPQAGQHSRSRENSPSDHDRDKKKASIGNKIKRTWLAGINRTGGLVEERRSEKKDDREKEKEIKEKERVQSHSWSGGSSASSVWSQGSDSSGDRHGGKGSSSAKASGDAGYQPPWLLLAEQPVGGKKTTKDPERGRVNSESGASELARIAGLGIEDEIHGPLGWKVGKAWTSVPEEAVAMVLPLQTSPDPSRESADAQGAGPGKRSLEVTTFFTDAPSKLLLVYYVPFNSNASSAADPNREPQRRFSTGKLLRKMGSKERLGVHFGSHDNNSAVDTDALYLVHPLPFRSFRIVACVVEPEDLRCEPELPSWPAWEAPDSEPGHDSDSPALGSDFSGSPKEATQQNRFPTVIAVCHSRSQGVEFVMEGLDRLGLCKGQSAWGPTGYEEWRGSGLSEEGRGLLDILWAGCVGVMGLHGK